MTRTTGKAFQTIIPIRFEHCDVAGIIYYPRIFLVMALIVERWFDSFGCDYWHLHMERSEGIPAVRAQCEFLRPCHLGDKLECTLEVERLGRSSFTLLIRAWRPGEDQECFRGQLVLVWSQISGGMSSLEIPEKYRRAMEPYLVV